MSCGTDEFLLSSLREPGMGRIPVAGYTPSLHLLCYQNLSSSSMNNSLTAWHTDGALKIVLLVVFFFSPVASYVPGSAPCSQHQTLCSSQFSSHSQAGVHFSSLIQPLCSLSLNIKSDWKPHGACSYLGSDPNSNDLSKHSLFATMIHWR